MSVSSSLRPSWFPVSNTFSLFLDAADAQCPATYGFDCCFSKSPQNPFCCSLVALVLSSLVGSSLDTLTPSLIDRRNESSENRHARRVRSDGFRTGSSVGIDGRLVRQNGSRRFGSGEKSSLEPMSCDDMLNAPMWSDWSLFRRSRVARFLKFGRRLTSSDAVKSKAIAELGPSRHGSMSSGKWSSSSMMLSIVGRFSGLNSQQLSSSDFLKGKKFVIDAFLI